MFKKIKLTTLGFLMLLGLASSVAVSTVPLDTAQACPSFITIPAWYEGVSSNCKTIDPPTQSTDGFSRFVWRIALNVIEIAMQLIAYIAVAFIIYGGFMYMTSDGSPERRAQGTKTILNAAIGVAIAISAVAIKNLLWDVITGQANDYGVYEVSATFIVASIFKTVYFIAGAIAVIVVILSGINYVTANGNPAGITKAKRSLLYGIIGLCIVAVAYPLTLFIIGRL